MKLKELEPTFLKWKDDSHFEGTNEIAVADGIQFLCPVCFKKNGGKVGTHAII